MKCYLEKGPGRVKWQGKIYHDITRPHYVGPEAEFFSDYALGELIEQVTWQYGATQFILIEKDEWGSRIQQELTDEMITYYLLREVG